MDLLQFDISSHDDSDASSQQSVDLGLMIGSLERGVNKTGGNSLFNKTKPSGGAIYGNTKGERYSNIRGSVQKSEGEVGAGEDDDISLGEIKVPGLPNTETYTNAKRGKIPTSKNPFPLGITTPSQPRHPTGALRGPLGETMNYEEDKVSPEKEDEKPLYDSSEGPIQAFKGGRIVHPTGKSGKNMVASFDSFGIKRSGGAGGVGQSSKGAASHAYLRETI